MANFQDKVVYQIYPKSFQDSNNDGFGDINGIIKHLDYLEKLGVDYIWLNPIFVSPQNDNGYDIEDYYAIDPSYGTMADLEKLISEAKKHNIYLMFDMVFNHTSTNHQWFKKALNGEQKYKDYYIFKKGKNGNPPTNWQSKFGGNAWKYVEKFDEYYLHLFDETQADLNWKNPEVRKEMANIVNFWIEKGIKGFRFDVINLIDKESFEDDYEGVGKRFYTDRPLVHTYLQELAQNSFGKYDDIITVGEMSATSIDNCVGYTNPNNHELSMVFSFHHLKVDYKNKEKWTLMPFDFQELKQLLNDWQLGMQEGHGWNALFWCCHDQPRVLSRFGDDKNYPKESAKMLATTIHLLRGTPYIYQGEEIGMTNAYFDNIEQYQDVESLNAFKILKQNGMSEDEIYQILQSKSRDNARTPMQWNNHRYAGFSNVEPWIAVNENYHDINVENNLKDLDSVFYYYQKLIKLRKQYSVILQGAYEPLLLDHPTIFAYKRIDQNDEIIVYNHFYDDNQSTITVDASQYDILLSNVQRNTLEDTIILKPYESLVLIKK
ncbi:alpha,alpha-phosphotrehalase [Erysipelatoclostridium sp. An173]|uniref:alpha,alpha-phosphotrehalase n=1 Tax=Erysipelatoclostridium sp. An173 TaxID=1965571 RepID=UPI000B393BEE|nr:alpha,alpha-phosphotrehalase [Erysipelatoclostridium sp. An173]OUP78752.1 alpha,alpha-phosphotrehalase [Erysipelatoclostridium sp. An173]